MCNIGMKAMDKKISCHRNGRIVYFRHMENKKWLSFDNTELLVFFHLNKRKQEILNQND